MTSGCPSISSRSQSSWRYRWAPSSVGDLNSYSSSEVPCTGVKLSLGDETRCRCSGGVGGCITTSTCAAGAGALDALDACKKGRVRRRSDDYGHVNVRTPCNTYETRNGVAHG